MKRQLLSSFLVICFAGLILGGHFTQARGDNLSSPAAGAPTVVSYQGQVTVNGTPFNGTGYFKFAVVNSAGSTTYWSNDDSSWGGGEPTDAVALEVTNGLFNVLLGDTALDNMTPLDSAVFSGTSRYLRVWFSEDNITFTLLIPDQRIAAVPYALQAEESKNAETLDGITSELFWQLGGNANTTFGSHYLGTSDAESLGLGANGQVVLTLDKYSSKGISPDIAVRRGSVLITMPNMPSISLNLRLAMPLPTHKSPVPV